MWNQIRPPWYEAIVTMASPLLPVTADIVVNAIQTDASMYQAMALILACFSQFWDGVHNSLQHIATLLQEHIPANVVPLNHSCLLQVLVSALYTFLLRKSEKGIKEVRFSDISKVNSEKTVTSFDATNSTPESIALAVAEALCSIDEDNKHTDQIEELLEQIKNAKNNFESGPQGSERVESTPQMTELLVSDLLMSSTGKSSFKV